MYVFPAKGELQSCRKRIVLSINAKIRFTYGEKTNITNPKQNPNYSHCTQLNSRQTAKLSIKDKTINFSEKTTRNYIHTTGKEKITKWHRHRKLQADRRLKNTTLE